MLVRLFHSVESLRVFLMFIQHFNSSQIVWLIKYQVFMLNAIHLHGHFIKSIFSMMWISVLDQMKTEPANRIWFSRIFSSWKLLLRCSATLLTNDLIDWWKSGNKITLNRMQLERVYYTLEKVHLWYCQLNPSIYFRCLLFVLYTRSLIRLAFWTWTRLTSSFEFTNQHSTIAKHCYRNRWIVGQTKWSCKLVVFFVCVCVAVVVSQ